MTKSFKKLAIPPRLNDRQLDGLSIDDHCKYLYYHNRLRGVLELIRKQGGTEKAILSFGRSSDWLRNIDHFARYWGYAWMYAYIHHTFPAHFWPDEYPETIDCLTFAFSWTYFGVEPEILRSFKFKVHDSFFCPVCGRRANRRTTVLRYGLPTCGCARRLIKPVRSILLTDGFPEGMLSQFRKRVSEQRVINLTQDLTTEPGSILIGLLGKRSGPSETKISQITSAGIPAFIFGGCDAVDSGESDGPVVGGLVLSGSDS